jgi:GcrA cell cycle regulator
MLNVAWTDDRVATLTRLHEAGLSCSQIAAELGDCTRNAVIGKLHRLGLPQVNKPGNSYHFKEKKDRPAQRERKPRLRIIAAHSKSQFQRVVETVESEPIKLRCAAVVPLNISLEQLHKGTCHYPYGDAPPFAYCGHAALDDRPYCDLHHELCHAPSNIPGRNRARPDAGSILRLALVPNVLALAVVGDEEEAAA